MIDISDGLAAEVNHICDQSGTGAEVTAADIPIHDQVRRAAQMTDKDPLDFALSGGEDFELLFSITPEHRQVLSEQGHHFPVAGRVTEPATDRTLRLADGTRVSLAGGYNHFSGNPA
jgi:thiamine-monophosphate kinase